MIETQTSLNEWAEKTFGPMKSPAHMLARANTEMAELLTEITLPIPNLEKIREECADVTHVMLRLAGWCGQDLTDVFRITAPLVPRNMYAPAIRANAWIAFLFERLDDSNIIKNVDAARHIGAIIIKLAEICVAAGGNLGEEVDKKAVILRSRKWELDGAGCGYHIEDISDVNSVICEHFYRDPVSGERKSDAALYDCGHMHKTYEEAQKCEEWINIKKEYRKI